MKKIYFDMDGVLADFDRGVREICGMESSDLDNPDKTQDDLMWEGIRKAGNFYDRLEPMPGAIELFRIVYERYGRENCQILTAVPKEKRRIVTAGEDKKNWVKRLISPDVRMNIVMREEKKDYASDQDCILVDDLAKNIREWEAFGGKGVLFTDAEQAEAELRNLGVL